MGLADKAIAGAIRAVAKSVGSAEKNVTGYIGSKVLNARASGLGDARYTINGYISKFFPKAAEKDVVRNYGVASMVPRSYMRPFDLKFVRQAGKNGLDPKPDKVYLAGHDITDHWYSGNFKPEHWDEYMPNGGHHIGYSPKWWKGDMLDDVDLTWRKFIANPLGKEGGIQGQYKQRLSDYGPAEIEMGREWIAATGASGAAFWGAVSKMGKPNLQRQQPQPAPPDAEQGR